MPPKGKLKKVKLKVTKKKVEPRADIPYRVGMNPRDFAKVPHKDPFVNKFILNDLMPVRIKSAIIDNNSCFSQLYNLNKEF